MDELLPTRLVCELLRCMMKKNNFFTGLKYIVVLAVTVTIICIVLNLEVAQIISNDSFLSLHQLEKNHPNSDISKICVQYVTEGTMWRMIESTTETEKGDMLFFSLFDLRCLKDNEYFLIDYHYDFIVCTPKSLSFLLGDKLKIVIPSKVYAKPRSTETQIAKQNNSQFFHVSDLNFYGKLKIFLRSFMVFFSGYFILCILKQRYQKIFKK